MGYTADIDRTFATRALELAARGVGLVSPNPLVGCVIVSEDGSAVGEREGGWAAQPAADEFARLEPDREFLKTIAEKTRGEVVDGDSLPSFVASLSTRSAPITEPWIRPLWHHPLYFLLAIVCLAGEWGLRRFNGLP